MAMRCTRHQSTKASAVSSGPLSTRTRVGRPYSWMRSSRTRITRALGIDVPDLDRESLPIAFVEDVEGPKPAAVVERVGHEIEGPGLVQARWREQGLAEARREAPFRAPRQIEPERAVHSIHALVV